MNTPINDHTVVARPDSLGELPKTLTGIRGLDEITGGGLPAGRPALVCGGPGSGKTLLALTFLVNGATRFGEPGVLMTFEENAAQIASDVASLGFDLPKLIEAKKLSVDYVRVERAEIEETGEYDLEGLFVRLGYAIGVENDAPGAHGVVTPCCGRSCGAVPVAEGNRPPCRSLNRRSPCRYPERRTTGCVSTSRVRRRSRSWRSGT